MHIYICTAEEASPLGLATFTTRLPSYVFCICMLTYKIQIQIQYIEEASLPGVSHAHQPILPLPLHSNEMSPMPSHHCHTTSLYHTSPHNTIATPHKRITLHLNHNNTPQCTMLYHITAHHLTVPHQIDKL